MRSSTNGEEIKKWVRSSLLIGCWEFLYSGKRFSLVDQSDFLFSIVWSVGATLDGNGRIAFDKFLRNLISGMNDAFPRPKSIKISKQTNFPDRGSIYDFLFVKTGNGSWEDWASLVEKKGLFRQKLSIRKFRFTEKNSNVPKIWSMKIESSKIWFLETFEFRFPCLDGTSRNDHPKCKHNSTKLLLEDTFPWSSAPTFICWTNRHVIIGHNWSVRPPDYQGSTGDGL